MARVRPGVEVLHATFNRHVYARHAHEGMTVALVDSGAASFECAGREHVARAGTAFVIHPQERHTGRPASPAGYRYRVLYIAPPALPEPLGAEAGRLSLPASGVLDDQPLIEALAGAHQALVSRVSSLARETALLEVGRALSRHPAERPAGGAAGASARAARLAREYLLTHAAEDVSLVRLAEVCGVGVPPSVRSFSAALGMPPHAYQTQLRIWRARSLLRERLRPAEAAAETGFCDQAHFTRVFTRYTGVTPGRFLNASPL